MRLGLRDELLILRNKIAEEYPLGETGRESLARKIIELAGVSVFELTGKIVDNGLR